jgi:uncharacterized protein (UPF0335 family)
MIRKIISLYRIWRLKREIKTIETEIEEFYLTLMSRNSEFQEKLDIEKLHQRFINLRTIEVKELNRQIKELMK